MEDVLAGAAAEAARYAETDPVYAELMRTYVVLGEALSAGDESLCADMVDRAVGLGRVMERESEQAWATWRARGGA